MTHGGSNSAVVSHRLPDGMGALGQSYAWCSTPCYKPTSDTWGNSSCQETPTHPAPLIPTSPSIQAESPNGTAHQAGTQPCVCANIHPKEFKIAFVIQIFEWICAARWQEWPCHPAWAHLANWSASSDHQCYLSILCKWEKIMAKPQMKH